MGITYDIRLIVYIKPPFEISLSILSSSGMEKGQDMTAI